MDYRKLFEENDIVLSDLQYQQLALYADLLVQWNEKFNLTAITNKDEIYVKHFLDCILLSKQYHPQGLLADVGTGAGFPGVVLKIYDPSLQVDLIEPNGKKITFLNEVIRQLNLEGIHTYNERSEDFVKNHFEQYDYVTARAVAALNILCELCLPLIHISGHFLSMKGPRAYQELEDAQKAIKTLGGQQISIQSFGLEENTRVIIDIEKKEHTPSKYPRNYSQIKKKPL